MVDDCNFDNLLLTLENIKNWRMISEKPKEVKNAMQEVKKTQINPSTEKKNLPKKKKKSKKK